MPAFVSRYPGAAPGAKLDDDTIRQLLETDRPSTGEICRDESTSLQDGLDNCWDEAMLGKTDAAEVEFRSLRMMRRPVFPAFSFRPGGDSAHLQVNRLAGKHTEFVPLRRPGFLQEREKQSPAGVAPRTKRSSNPSPTPHGSSRTGWDTATLILINRHRLPPKKCELGSEVIDRPSDPISLFGLP
jgi:hypothetical protein